MPTKDQTWKDQPSARRARGEVIRALQEEGGSLEDKSGRAGSALRDKLGRGRSLTEVLARMQEDGLIVREIRGKRTFRIALTDQAATLAGSEPVITANNHRESPVAEQLGQVDDVEKLALKLLDLFVKKVTESAGTLGEFKQLQAELGRRNEELNGARRQIGDLMSELAEAQEKIRLLQHNLDLETERAREAPKKDRLTQALSPQSQKALEAFAKTLSR